MTQNLNFVALDFETANSNHAICQIGMVRFRNGKEVDKYETLIDPDDYFNEYITNNIHGIAGKDVEGKPKFFEIYEEICNFIKNDIIVHHSGYDKTAWEKSIARYELQNINNTWLDSCWSVSKIAWPEQAELGGYGLEKLAEIFDIEFGHHDALEDARVAGLIFLEACKKENKDVDDWLVKPVHTKTAKSLKREGNVEGNFQGVVIVFTGGFSAMEQKNLADLAAQAGCDVEERVTKKTTLLVVGEQDPNKTESSKVKRAKELNSKGQSIKILQESEFLSILESE